MTINKKWIKKYCSESSCNNFFFILESWSNAPNICEECRALNAKNSWPILERFFKTLNKNKSKFTLDEIKNRKEHLELLSLYKKFHIHKEIEKITFLKKQ
jgi:hypothetical protein